MDKPTPLINSSLLSQYSGQTVRVVGKVQKLTGNTLLVQTSDLGNVEISLNPDSDISGSTYVEVTGKVSDGGSGLDGHLIREFTTVDCGENVGKCRFLREKRGERVADASMFVVLIGRHDTGGERRADLGCFPTTVHRLGLSRHELRLIIVQISHLRRIAISQSCLSYAVRTHTR